MGLFVCLTFVSVEQKKKRENVVMALVLWQRGENLACHSGLTPSQ